MAPPSQCVPEPRCVQPSPLQLLQVSSKGWEAEKLLCKELDLNWHWTRRAGKHLLNPITLNHFQERCIFRSERFDTGSSNLKKKIKK